MKYKLQSIKLYVFLIQFFFSMYLVVDGLFTADQFIDFQKWMIGFYFAGNLAAKIIKKFNK